MVINYVASRHLAVLFSRIFFVATFSHADILVNCRKRKSYPIKLCLCRNEFAANYPPNPYPSVNFVLLAPPYDSN